MQCVLLCAATRDLDQAFFAGVLKNRTSLKVHRIIAFIFE